jgi:hypothetical protein
VKKHKYSDDCTCQNCNDTFNAVLAQALDKGSSADRGGKMTGHNLDDGTITLYLTPAEARTMKDALKVARAVYDDVKLRMHILGTNKAYAATIRDVDCQLKVLQELGVK